MLVGGGVVDGLHPVFLQRRRDAPVVLHRAEERHHLDRGMLPAGQRLQFLVDGIEVVFGDLEEHEPRRPLADDLAAELRPDRPAGPGDHHHPAADVAVHEVGARRHRVAAQQILDRDIGDLADPGAAGDDVRHAGDGLDLHGQVADPAQDRRALRPGEGGHGQEQDLRAVIPDQPLQFGGRMHRAAADDAPLEGGIVIDEGDRQIFRPVDQRMVQLPPRRPGAVDQHERLGPVHAEQEHPAHEEAQPPDEDQRQERIDHRHGPRHRRRHDPARHHQDHRRGQHAEQHGDIGARGDVAHHRAVEAQADEDEKARRDQDGEEGPVARIRQETAAVQPQHHGQQEAERDQAGIGQELDQPLVAPAQTHEPAGERKGHGAGSCGCRHQIWSWQRLEPLSLSRSLAVRQCRIGPALQPVNGFVAVLQHFSGCPPKVSPLPCIRNGRNRPARPWRRHGRSRSGSHP